MEIVLFSSDIFTLSLSLSLPAAVFRSPVESSHTQEASNCTPTSSYDFCMHDGTQLHRCDSDSHIKIQPCLCTEQIFFERNIPRADNNQTEIIESISEKDNKIK